MSYRRPPRGRRGRAALAWAAVMFLGVQLTAGLLLDYVWPEVRFPSLASILASERAAKRGPDVVCLGSSRFGLGLSPSVMQAAFRRELGPATRIRVLNAAVPSGDAITGDFILDALFHEGARPALAVIEVSPDMVNSLNDWYSAHVTRQLRWDDVPGAFPEIFQANQLHRLAVDRFFPLSDHRREICRRAAAALDDLWTCSRAAPSSGPDRADDDEPPPAIDWEQVMGGKATGLVRTEQTRACLYIPSTKLRDYRIGGATAAALERLLRRCRAGGVRVVLVGVPVTSKFRDFITPGIDAAYRDYMARLCRTYDCRFVDWRDRVPDSCFCDIHHLLPEGNAYFSNRLTAEVLAPLWRASHPGMSSTASQTASR